MFKKMFIVTTVLFLWLFSAADNTSAQLVASDSAESKNSVNIYFFYGDGCPHCADEKPFLEELNLKNKEVKIYSFEVWKSAKNRSLWTAVGKALKADVSGVPFTVVGDKVFIGYAEYLTKKQIEDRVSYCLTNDCPDSVAKIVGIDDSQVAPKPTETVKNNGSTANGVIPEKINFPLLGDIKTKNLSLPIFTVVLGALDGFNPCAMWTLLFLISLLLGMKDRKRMWILGIAFIFTSAFVYFLFMAAWLNLLLFIGFIVWVRVLVAAVALGGGGYSIREYFVNKNSGCKVTGDEKRKIVFEKLKNITQKKQFLIALGGIVLLAFAVNLVELICSAGLPVVFTQILALSGLTKMQYYSHMVLYIFVFMLDDLIVFFTAMITLQVTGLSTKYSRASHLIGGVLMVIIGLLLLFKPELLMFG